MREESNIKVIKAIKVMKAICNNSRTLPLQRRIGKKKRIKVVFWKTFKLAGGKKNAEKVLKDNKLG